MTCSCRTAAYASGGHINIKTDPDCPRHGVTAVPLRLTDVDCCAKHYVQSTRGVAELYGPCSETVTDEDRHAPAPPIPSPRQPEGPKPSDPGATLAQLSETVRVLSGQVLGLSERIVALHDFAQKLADDIETLRQRPQTAIPY